MEEHLTTEERAILNWIASQGRATHMRRAQLLLLRDQEMPVRAIASQVNLSRTQVYHWLHAFQGKRLAIFPADLLAAAQAEPATAEYPAAQLSIEIVPTRPIEAELPLRKAPGVLPDDPMSEAGRKVLGFHFQRMLQHEPGTRLGEDIEALHDMRVATRRMRAAFRVFAPYFDPDVLRPFLKGLRRSGRTLGRVRDLDVFMEKAQHYLAEQPEEERPDLGPLLAEWQEQLTVARERMVAFLDGKRYQRFVLEFGAFLNTPQAGALPPPADRPAPQQVAQAAPILIYSCYDVVRGYEPLIGHAPLETLHALRIDSKRLRYTLEFFQEVLGPEAKDVIKEVVTVQDHLGHLNDADVATRLLIGFLEQWSRQAGRERVNISGVARYLVAKQDELHALLDSFPEVWQHFNRPEMRRQLALAVSTL